MAVSGKFNMYLNRKVDVDTLPIIDKNMMLGDLEMERRGWPDTVNEVKVIFPRMLNGGEIHGCGSDEGQWGMYDSARPDGESHVLEHNDLVLDSILSLACGSFHTLIVKTEDGTLWSSGLTEYYAYGALGHGSGVNMLEVFTRIGDEGGWAEVCCTTHASYMRKANGYLYSCGQNNKGELGLGDTTPRYIPTQIMGGWGGWGALAKSGGSQIDHMVAMGADGKLWGWGEAAVGQLGQGVSPPSYYTTPQQIGTAEDWVQIALGQNATLVINDSNELWCTGDDSNGELGLGVGGYVWSLTKVPGSDWEKVASAQLGSLAIKTDGTLWATGYNQFGELGLGDAAVGQKYTSFTQVGTDTDWLDIEMGSVHSIARKRDGTIWTCGWNFGGQLGVGDDDDRTEFTQAGVMNEWRRMACADYATVVAGDLR